MPHAAASVTMSTQQQALMMETLLALRRTSKRRAYGQRPRPHPRCVARAVCSSFALSALLTAVLAADSDSDSSIDQTTNRGNKLKRRARFVHQGRLTSSMGPAAYREVADLSGYQRAIISRNPALVDEDGYDIDSDDDEGQVQEAVAAAVEGNPYHSIRLERACCPLDHSRFNANTQ